MTFVFRQGGLMTQLHQFRLSAVIAASLAAGLAAQTSPVQPPASPDRMTAIVVTGCVQRNTARAASATSYAVGTSGTQADALFILANVRTPAAGSPTPEAAALASTVTTYRLYGDDKEVEQNLGRSVEIGGTVDQGDAAVAHPGQVAGSKGMPKLTVTTVKELTGSCSK
jgi:hypothetical protein